ncbi:hypothetical protein SD934_04210 [Lactobacillus jensenii]|nr:hypothetical protein [Lactobacillus jensenii]MDX5102557.1 hypothetical protein [Lactobacillus jensenii]MDX5104156.1 hypothetical protein [Lactobacillus jensenii]MDX5114865.1 hypothetical protein [Lactobacillus jensenii]
MVKRLFCFFTCLKDVFSVWKKFNLFDLGSGNFCVFTRLPTKANKIPAIKKVAALINANEA